MFMLATDMIFFFPLISSWYSFSCWPPVEISKHNIIGTVVASGNEQINQTEANGVACITDEDEIQNFRALNIDSIDTLLPCYIAVELWLNCDVRGCLNSRV
jgi:hypothetical protein